MVTLWSSPNHVPNKSRAPIKNTNHLPYTIISSLQEMVKCSWSKSGVGISCPKARLIGLFVIGKPSLFQGDWVFKEAISVQLGKDLSPLRDKRRKVGRDDLHGLGDGARDNHFDANFRLKAKSKCFMCFKRGPHLLSLKRRRHHHIYTRMPLSTISNAIGEHMCHGFGRTNLYTRVLLDV